MHAPPGLPLSLLLSFLHPETPFLFASWVDVREPACSVAVCGNLDLSRRGLDMSKILSIRGFVCLSVWVSKPFSATPPQDRISSRPEASRGLSF